VKEKTRKVLGLLLAVCMTMTMVPMGAFAESGVFTSDDMNNIMPTGDGEEAIGTVSLIGRTNPSGLTVLQAVYEEETDNQDTGTYDYEIDLNDIKSDANGVDDGYTVGNYGEGPLIYLNQANKSYRVTGETDYYGLAIDGENISLTLDGVDIYMNGSLHALELFQDLTLNLEGKNRLSGYMAGVGSFSEKCNLTIQGTGSLETNSAVLMISIKDFTLKSGKINGRLSADNIIIEGGTVNAVATGWDSTAITAESSVTISGGTLDIQSESGYGIYAYYNSGTITIIGGSVNVSGGEGFGPTNIAPTDGHSRVYKTKLGGLPANTLITDLTAPIGYGYTHMYTDDEGWLYLWLPEGEQTVAFKVGDTKVNKSFTIAANNDNLFAAVDMDINVGNEGDLKVALESLLPSNINVTENFDCSLQIKLGGNHILTIPTGKTVAIADNGFIDLQSNTLNIKGGGELVLQSGYPYNFYGDEGKLDLENIRVTSMAAGMGAIRVKNVVVGDGATIVSDGESAHYLLRIEEGHTCTVKPGGTIDTGKFWDYGILIAGGVLHIDGGTVKLGQGEGINNAIFMGSGSLRKTSGSLVADVDAVINLPNPGISIQGFANSFKDRSVEFTAEEAIVGERDGLPFADGLTAGSYHWDGSFFSKEAIAITAQPQSLEFHRGEITGSLTVSAKASNDSPIGYQWCTIDEYGSYDDIDGATGDTFLIPTDLTPGTYRYVCWLNADKCDSVSSNIATVTVIGELPAVPYTLTIDGSYAPTAGGGIYREGDTVSIKAGSRSGYSFAGWTSSDNISFADKNSPTTTFIMPGKSIRVTANWITKDKGGSGGGSKGGSGGGGGAITPPTTPTIPIVPPIPVDPTPDPPAGDIGEDANDKGKTESPFADIKEDSWYSEAVNYVYEKGLMRGTSDDSFNPDGMTTRGMIVTILYRLEGPTGSSSNIFSDVSGEAYYADPVGWATSHSIVSGYGDDKFGPDDSITREQLAVILMNYARYKGLDISPKSDISSYEDSDDISDWAKEAMEWANAIGLIQGSGSALNPKDNATRAEVATILYRMLNK